MPSTRSICRSTINTLRYRASLRSLLMPSLNKCRNNRWLNNNHSNNNKVLRQDLLSLRYQWQIGRAHV